MKESTPIQDKGRFKKIILSEDVPAYFWDGKKNLTKKGSFQKGKILKVDSEIFQKDSDGGNVFKVLSVRHRNIFIPVSKKNAEYLTIQHIKDMCMDKLKAYGYDNAAISNMLPEETKAMQEYINGRLDADAPESDTLSMYYEGAFSSSDGFDFAGKFDEAFEIPVSDVENKSELVTNETEVDNTTGDSDCVEINILANPRTGGRAFEK